MHYVPYLEGRFHTASPDSQGVPSGAILQFLTELDRLDVDLHSLYIFRNGFQLLGANRRPYQGDPPRRIYSAAKALTGLAVLFAIQEGLVSLKTRLTQLFPEDLPETVTPRMESITVYHLLTMTTGHDRDTFRPVLNSTNSVRAFLEEPLDFEPGTHFLYNNGVPHILGLIVKKVSGINYLDFLRPRFLEPLGIYCTVEQTQRGELEGSRTMCTAEGFAKLSLFYLQEGNWNGQQLLDARLVRAAVSFQVPTRRCSSISFMHSDQLAGYGFQLWRNAREGARLDGGRSQFGFLFPDKEMAIVCNAIEEDSGLIPAVLWDTLYSAIQPQAVPDHGESARLKSYLSHWSCAPRTAAQPSFLDDYYGCVYVLEENPWHLRTLSLSLREGQPHISLETDQESCTLQVGLHGDWIANDAFLSMPMENERLNMMFHTGPVRHWVSGGWASDFCFIFQVRSTDWMDYNTFYCRFNGQRLSLVVESNMERMSHCRRRIPMRPWPYPDHQIEGKRQSAN